MDELTSSEKALCYYKAALSHVVPRYVPARVRLPARVRGDGPFYGTFADAGEHDRECNRWGAVAVRAASDARAVQQKLAMAVSGPIAPVH